MQHNFVQQRESAALISVDSCMTRVATLKNVSHFVVDGEWWYGCITEVYTVANLSWQALRVHSCYALIEETFR
jgi:hypothetical protein